jgi:peptidoglycan/xylan/chitin deacetylase (PgdA/CDA1 family)
MPVAILFYHRVADTFQNPWTITPGDFARHLDWLQTHFDVVSLSEAQRRVRSPQNNRPTVSLTFDDGYADNMDFAVPELLRRGLTATYFVTTRYVQDGEPFPHDVTRGEPLPVNTIEELQLLASQGFEIGAHTQTHCDIGQLADLRSAREEIVGSREILEQWLGQRVRYFAYPYGLPHCMSQMSFDLLVDHQFDGFCSGYGAWNWPNTGGFHLRRIHADPGCQRLKNWLTLDSRKLKDCARLPFDEQRAQLTESTLVPPALPVSTRASDIGSISSPATNVLATQSAFTTYS